MKWGLIGASDIAETRVIPAIRQNLHQIVSVYSTNADRAAEYAKKNNIPNFTTDLSELLNSDIDASQMPLQVRE